MMDAIKTMLTATGATGGAYAASNDPATNKFMMQIIENTPLDPSAIEYGQAGMDPLWAFITVATIGMGPTIARTFQDAMASRNVRAERTLEAKLGGYVEKGPTDV